MKKRRLLLIALGIIGIIACSVVLAVFFGLKSKGRKHSHSWGKWTVEVANKPTDMTEGKATRTCTGNGGCNAAATDREIILPALTSADYTMSADTATCTTAGAITYTYDKNGVSVSFDIATPVNDSAHNYGDYVYTDEAGHYKICANNPDHRTGPEEHDFEGAEGACSKCGFKRENRIERLILDTPVTVEATKDGVYCEFTAETDGNYTLTCYSDNAKVLLKQEDGKTSELSLPYVFGLNNGQKIVFIMCSVTDKETYGAKITFNGATPTECTHDGIQTAGWRTVKEANCTEEGQEELRCEVCKQVVETRAVSVNGKHSYVPTVTQKPTRTDGGEAQLICAHNSEHKGETVNLPELTSTEYAVSEDDGLVTYVIQTDIGEVRITEDTEVLETIRNAIETAVGTSGMVVKSDIFFKSGSETKKISYEFGDNYVHAKDESVSTERWIELKEDGTFFALIERDDPDFGRRVTRDNSVTPDDFKGYGFRFSLARQVTDMAPVNGAARFIAVLYEYASRNPKSKNFVEYVTQDNGKTTYKFSYGFGDPDEQNSRDHTISVEFTLNGDNFIDFCKLDAKSYADGELFGNETFTVTQSSRRGAGEEAPVNPYKAEDITLSDYKLKCVTVDDDLKVTSAGDYLSDALNQAAGSSLWLQVVEYAPEGKVNFFYDEVKVYLREKGGSGTGELIEPGYDGEGRVLASFDPVNRLISLGFRVGGEYDLIFRTENTEKVVSLVIYVAVNDVTLTESSKEVFTGETFTLSAELEPSDATVDAVSWTSSDLSVVTVDEFGKVKAKGAGEAKVICTVSCADGDKTAECAVTVNKRVYGEGVHLFPDLTFDTDGITFELNGKYGNTYTVEIYSISTGKKQTNNVFCVDGEKIEGYVSESNVSATVSTLTIKLENSGTIITAAQYSGSLDGFKIVITCINEKVYSVGRYEIGTISKMGIPLALDERFYNSYSLTAIKDGAVLTNVQFTVGGVRTDNPCEIVLNGNNSMSVTVKTYGYVNSVDDVILEIALVKDNYGATKGGSGTETDPYVIDADNPGVYGGKLTAVYKVTVPKSKLMNIRTLEGTATVDGGAIAGYGYAEGEHTVFISENTYVKIEFVKGGEQGDIVLNEAFQTDETWKEFTFIGEAGKEYNLNVVLNDNCWGFDMEVNGEVVHISEDWDAFDSVYNGKVTADANGKITIEFQNTEGLYTVTITEA